MQKEENTKVEKGKDTYRYNDRKRGKETKEKGKKGKEEIKEKLSRWNEERIGEEEEKMYRLFSFPLPVTGRVAGAALFDWSRSRYYDCDFDYD